MKANILGWCLGLALVGAVACGGGGAKDAGIDPGIDSPVPVDVPADEFVPDVPPDRIEDLVPADLPDEARPDLLPEDLLPDVPPLDVPPELDLPVTDDGTIGDVPDLSPDVPPADVPPEPGDTCEGPECVPCTDDGLECTDSARDDAGGCIVVLQAGFCLIGNACVPQGEKDPADPCKTCQPEVDTGAYVAAAGLPCEDATPCSLGGVCTVDAKCVPAMKPCDDGNVCTVDKCVSNACQHLPFTSTCDDGDKCTLYDTCVNGVCKGTAVTCVSDNNPCTTEACDPATGRCASTNNDNPCDDLNWCTVDDACLNGACTGSDRDCRDADPCSRDTCVAQTNNTGYCNHVPIPGQPCEDGDLCTTNDMCGEDLVCRPGGLKVCNDNNVCTDDSCDTSVGCVFAPHTRPCDDGDPCTVSDTCGPTGCHGTPRSCDDGNPCTSDSCTYGSCLNLAYPNGWNCDDGNECTTGDRCLGSYCVPTGTLSCDDGDACTMDACVKGLGCTHAPATCDDGNPCTTDSCAPAIGCVHVPNTLSCDDGDPCTVSDTCAATACHGAPKNCSDGDPCTNDTCSGGTCLHAPNYGACDDGNFCTDGEKCTNGICGGGKTVTCNDVNECTSDSCDPAVGCVFSPLPGTCDDRSVCTTSDHCDAGKCTGAPLNCDDGNYCTDDLCDPIAGCYHENNDLLCNDGNACTMLDQCRLGACGGINMFANPLSKGATLQFTKYGTPGFGLDVDGNAATCAPAPDCSGGIDNYFGKMSIFIDDQFAPDLNKVVADGRLALLLEHESPGPGAGPYNLNVMFGKRTDPTSCNPATAGCNYLAYGGDLIGQCTPRYILSNATLVGNTLTAGGKEFQAVIYFAIGNVMLPQTLKWAQVQATVTLDGSGKVVGGSGVLAGAIDVKQLKLDLQTVPSAQFSPYTMEQVVQQIDSRLCGGTSECGDMDTDGKAGKDAASIGLPFTIVTGNGVGRL